MKNISNRTAEYVKAGNISNKFGLLSGEEKQEAIRWFKFAHTHGYKIPITAVIQGVYIFGHTLEKELYFCPHLYGIERNK